MTGIATLSEFLLQSGSQYRVFDLGRGIRKLTSQEFLEIENNQSPHPYPRLGYAWLGVVFWNKQLSKQHYIWLLKLPLDEQGMLVAAARNHFLSIVLEALGKQLDQKSPDSLPEHPYGFNPSQQQMADFNSVIREQLKLPLSQYFQAAHDYISQPGSLNWNDVPLQGLADLVARIEQKDILELLLSQFDQLAREVQISLCNSLENQNIPLKFTEKVLNWMALHSADQSVQLAGVRALSQSQASGLVKDRIQHFLANPENLHSDLLITLSGRHWHRFTQDNLLMDYFETLAQFSPELFTPIFADLVRTPQLRAPLLELLRRTDKSDALTAAIGTLFSEQNR